MQIYSAWTLYTSEYESEIRVKSSRCLYVVWVDEDEITLRGPGVEETGSRESFPEFDSIEDLAIVVVIRFENSDWPKEDEE